MKNQLTLNLYSGGHGGRRPKSGRKRIHSVGVSHKKRESISHHYPLHINFKYNTYIRSDAVYDIFKISLQNARRHKFRILHYSIQSNHIHIIAEAKDNQILYRGMRSITNTIAMSVKSLKNLDGSIQIERYHLHVLKTPREAYNAFNYVIYNEHHHAQRQAPNKFSSIYGFLELDEPVSWLGKQTNRVIARAVEDSLKYPNRDISEYRP